MAQVKLNIKAHFFTIIFFVCLLLILGNTHVWANTSNINHKLLISDDLVSQAKKLTVPEQLEVIHLVNSQKSEQARDIITNLESLHVKQPLSSTQYLRLSMLHCFNLLEFGKTDQAIALARKGEASARALRYDTARPYFLQCEAFAHDILGNSTSATLLVEESLRLARKYNEKQAIINSLYARSRLNTSLENYNASIEDLHLALDLYPEAEKQYQKWYVLPKSYIQSEISNVFYSKNDFEQAVAFSELALADPSAFGKAEFAIAVNLARIHISLKSSTQQIKVYLEIAEQLNFRLHSEHDKAFGLGMLSVVSLYLGNLDIAETQVNQAIEGFTKLNDKFFIMRLKRTLAKIYFAQQKTEQALTLMDNIIEQAISLEQYSDLQDFYQVLSDYYQKQNDFKNAYLTQMQLYDVAKKANDKLDNAHFMQFKALLQAQENSAQQHSHEHYILSKKLVQTVLISLVFFMLVLGIAFIYRKPQFSSDKTKVTTPKQQINMMINEAKKTGYPLSLITIDTSHIRQVDVANVQLKLAQSLHELDRQFRLTADEIIILMPHTSAIGQTLVINNISTLLVDWQTDNSATSIGFANLQALDTFAVLLKRARANQFIQSKPALHSNHSSSVVN